MEELIDSLLYRFDCDVDSGEFEYLTSTGRAKKGNSAGTLRKDGTVSICIDGSQYLRSHLVWLLQYGMLPDRLHHIDLNNSNDSIENLEEVEYGFRNVGTINVNNTSGFNRLTYYPKRDRYKYSFGGMSRIYPSNPFLV